MRKMLVAIIITTMLSACGKQINKKEYLYTEIYKDGTESPTDTLRVENDSVAFLIAFEKHITSRYSTMLYNDTHKYEKPLAKNFRLIDLDNNNINTDDKMKKSLEEMSIIITKVRKELMLESHFPY